jgi:hypothetical protein
MREHVDASTLPRSVVEFLQLDDPKRWRETGPMTEAQLAHEVQEMLEHGGNGWSPCMGGASRWANRVLRVEREGRGDA